MNNAPTNSDDVIDSRDVIARIEELESERDSFEPPKLSAADLCDPALAVNDRPAQTWEAENPDDAAELAALKTLEAEAEGYAPDWRYGTALIRDDYFETYAREYAEDVCELPTTWPANCIDWEQAASELQQDYTAVDFDGVTYWVR